MYGVVPAYIEVFSAWRWKVCVCAHHPHDQMSRVEAMRCWMQGHKVFPKYMARENICCDADENVWPNAGERQY